MLPINKYITIRNRNISNRNKDKIKYLVIHYVGAVSTAKNNCSYFYNTYRGASAHYFVDDNSIWQCVEDKDVAWHCGAKTYKHPSCRNSNSIGIEMCCFKNNGVLDISNEVVANTLELAAYICRTYDIPLSNVVRHYDVTGKQCPAPFVSNSARWDDFKNRLGNILNGEVSSPTAPVENNTMEKKMYVKVNTSLNIRSGAGTNYKVVGSLKNGNEVTVYEMSNNFARIGNNQWVCATYLVESTPVQNTTKIRYVKVNTSLNVRVGAGTNYRAVSFLKNGAQVTVYEEKNGWSRIGDNKWVSSSYLTDSKPTTVPTKTVIASALNVRNGIGTSHKIVKVIKKGTKVSVYEEKSGWSRIGDGQWVNSKYIS